jgi:hypothetical protein
VLIFIVLLIENVLIQQEFRQERDADDDEGCGADTTLNKSGIVIG